MHHDIQQELDRKAELTRRHQIAEICPPWDKRDFNRSYWLSRAKELVRTGKAFTPGDVDDLLTILEEVEAERDDALRDAADSKDAERAAIKKYDDAVELAGETVGYVIANVELGEVRPTLYGQPAQAEFARANEVGPIGQVLRVSREV